MTWSLRLETSEIWWSTLRQPTIAMENPPLSVVFNQERRQIFHGYVRSIGGYFWIFARTFGRSDSMIRGGWFWWHGKKADRDIFKSVKSSSFFLKSWKKGETNNFQGPRFAIFLVWHQKHKSAVMTCTGQLWMCWHLFEWRSQVTRSILSSEITRSSMNDLVCSWNMYWNITNESAIHIRILFRRMLVLI